MSSTSRASIRLGSYQLHERIGEGGSSHVHRGVADDGQVVAIKLLAPTAELDDDSARARFEREIRTLAELDHPHVLKLLDHGVDEELGPYLVTPLVTGNTLRAVVDGHAICPEAALLLMRPALRALVALHGAGLVHRDLKPENMMAHPDGRIVLVDLGLAFRPGQTRYTDEGAVVGSVPYMAPEQIEGREVGPAADIWAVGVMLYEWMVGRRPFQRERPAEEAAAVLVGAHAPLRSADRRASDELGELVACCLVAEPAERPTAEALLAKTDSMIDWFDAAEESVEVASVVSAAADYQDRVAGFRVRRLTREASDAVDSGHMFAALRRVDRGLAYRPDDPGLTALSERAEAAGVVPTERAPIARGAVVTTKLTKREKTQLWLVLGGSALVTAVALVLVLSLRGNDSSADESAAPPSATHDTTTSEKPGEPATGQPADGKRVFGRMLNLLDRGMKLGEKKEKTGKTTDADADEMLQIFGGMVNVMKDGLEHDRQRRLDAGAAPTKPTPRP